MALIEDRLVAPRLILLASALAEELRDSGLPEPCFVAPLPGAGVSHDFCDCTDSGCGMAWTRLVVMTPNPAAAQIRSASGGSDCGAPLDITVEVGVGRCAPTMDGTSLPTAVEHLAATELQMADMAAMKRVLCSFSGFATDYPVTLTSYTPFGPQGGCVGGTWLATYEAVYG